MSDKTDDAQSGQSNWSHTIEYTPASYVEPRNLYELKQAVQRACAAGQTIRPRGSGHSWNGGIVTSGSSINTIQMCPDNSAQCVCKGKPASEQPCGRASCMDVSWQRDGDYWLLSVPPGITQGELSLLAQNQGCPLPTMGPAADITISGFVANGCHGTGWNEPTIAELLYGIELMGPDGELFYFDETTMPEGLRDLDYSPPEMMNIVRVSLGALGVITRMIFKLKADPFNLEVKSSFVTMTDVLDRNDPSKLQRYIESHDYIEIFWFPYNTCSFELSHLGWVPKGPESDTVWVIQLDRTSAPVSADAGLINTWKGIVDLTALLGGDIGEAVAFDMNLAPGASKMSVDLMKAKVAFDKGVVFKPRDAFLYQQHYFKGFLDLEWTIPMNGAQGFKDVVDAFYQVVDRMEDWRKNPRGLARYPVNISVHARFIKNSQALLSPSFAPAGSDTHVCYIEYLSYSNEWLTSYYNQFTQDFFAQANERGWAKYGTLPNWGKDVGIVPGFFSYAHGILDAKSGGQPMSRLERFLQVRDRIDPGGARFTNEYLEALFTGTDSEVAASAGARAVRADAASAGPALPSRSFLVSPEAFATLTAKEAAQTLDGVPLSLRHDTEASTAYLDGGGESCLLGYAHDAAAGTVTYYLALAAQSLSHDQVFERVGRFFPG